MIKYIFFILSTFSVNVWCFEKLEIIQINKVFVPALSSMARQDYSNFSKWFSDHALISVLIEKQMDDFLQSQIIPKLPLYGKVLNTRLVFNSITQDKYGSIVFIQDYENLFMVWRFNYYIKENGELSMKTFSVDNDNDLSKLYDGYFSKNLGNLNLDLQTIDLF